MQLSKRKIFTLRSTVRSLLLSFLLLHVGCSSSTEVLPTDAEMTAKWQNEATSLQAIAKACEETVATYNLADRYTEANGLIATTALENFEGCDIESGLQHLAKSKEGELYLLVTDQYRKGTGWIEETASKLTGGWVSWKSTILEEKGFLYAPQDSAALMNAPFPRLSIVNEPLDQFVGEYRGTSQISGNSSCEVWKLRPIKPNWYLFYHQSRECPF